MKEKENGHRRAGKGVADWACRLCGVKIGRSGGRSRGPSFSRKREDSSALYTIGDLVDCLGTKSGVLVLALGTITRAFQEAPMAAVA